jgi:pimeloyl-ACP methyl ester carboxylesterase
VRRLVLAAVSIAASLSALVPVAGAATSDLALHRGDFAGTFGISKGRSMFLECFGHGSPTVILDAGLRNGGAIWAERTPETPAGPTVLQALARQTRVCAYDRPGVIISFEPLEFSRSSPTFMPRVGAEAVYDLHRLLWNAKVPGPYVFVNHSTGGLIDRLYASTYPREVAGMVLVDALAEFIAGGPRGLDPAQMDAYEAVNNNPVEGIDYPDIESFAFRHSFAQQRAEERKNRFPDVPLSVISHGKPFALPEGLPGGLTSEAVERAWTYSQDQLAKLTPGAVHVVAKRSSHYVMLTQPQLVIDQVERVLRAVRGERR